jgi:hypothetical protein
MNIKNIKHSINQKQFHYIIPIAKKHLKWTSNHLFSFN